MGGFRARLESGPDVPVRCKKGQALLGYLACHPLRSHPRDTLATLLWGDMSQRCARHSLRQTLFVLRESLPHPTSPVVSSDADTVWLDATGVVADVLEFDRLAREGTVQSLERAGALYHGDLLAGIAVIEPGFEEWLRGERERLHDLAVEVFAKLLDLHRRAGATERAIQTGVRLLQLEPLQEAVHRTLMRLYLSLGRLGKAQRQYRTCEELLRRELGIEPDTETRQVLGRF